MFLRARITYINNSQVSLCSVHFRDSIRTYDFSVTIVEVQNARISNSLNWKCFTRRCDGLGSTLDRSFRASLVSFQYRALYSLSFFIAFELVKVKWVWYVERERERERVEKRKRRSDAGPRRERKTERGDDRNNLLHLQRLLLCITSTWNSCLCMCLLCLSACARSIYIVDASVHVQRQHFAVHSPFGRVYRYRSFPGSTERASFLLPAGRDTLIPSAREQSGSHHENLAVFQSTRFIPRTSVESSRSTMIYSTTIYFVNNDRKQWIFFQWTRWY